MKTEETKTRKGSTIGTLKSLKGVIEKLESLKMTNKEENEKLKEIQKKIFERWQSVEMGIEIAKESGETTK